MQKFSEEEIEQIILACKNGNMKEYDKLYKHFYSIVYYTAFQVFHDASKSQDAVQNTFIEVFNKIGTLKEPKTFTSWIRRITYRKCLNMITYEKKDSLHYAKEFDNDADIGDHNQFQTINEFSTNEVYRLVILGLGFLDERKRLIGHLKFLEGYTAKEISEIMNMKLDTVNSNIRRIREYIKDYLEKHGYSASDFLGIMSTPLLTQQHHNYLNGLSEIEHAPFVYPENHYISKGSFNKTLVTSIVTICSMVGVAGVAFTYKEPLSNTLHNIMQTNPHIQQITYNKELTNEPITIKVIVDSSDYDEFRINGKKTDKVNCNGVYAIELLKDGKAIDQQQIIVSNIDTDKPYVTKKVESKDKVILYFDDNNAINPESIQIFINDILQMGMKLNEVDNSLELEKDVAKEYVIKLQDTAKNVSEFQVRFR